jgi:hypothetical protein
VIGEWAARPGEAAEESLRRCKAEPPPRLDREFDHPANIAAARAAGQSR